MADEHHGTFPFLFNKISSALRLAFLWKILCTCIYEFELDAWALQYNDNHSVLGGNIIKFHRLFHFAIWEFTFQLEWKFKFLWTTTMGRTNCRISKGKACKMLYNIWVDLLSSLIVSCQANIHFFHLRTMSLDN